MPRCKAEYNASARRFRPTLSAPRPRLSPEDVQKLADKMRDAFKWDAAPKDFQLEAVKVQIEGVDMIVQAPTGSGKTAIAAGPHYWPGNERRFTLMVCPLLSLEEEMETSFQVDYRLRAIALNSKNGACSPKRLKEILDMKYQVILISPEMLQSRTFVDRVLRNGPFMRNIVSLFIDEAHCIVHWGADFRKKYGTLGKVRAFLPRGTPVMAVTATLTARVRRGIYSSLHFAQSEAPSRFINKGNDRSNVSIVVRACEHPLNTYADLDFVIPPSVRLHTDIPKTYLYVDNIAIGTEIIDYLNAKIDAQTRISSSNLPPLPRGLVRPFNATLSQEYRATAMSRFRAGDIRILVCTDAAGMGCNIPDIDRVVQWKLPSTFSHFIQRAGRAARGRNRTGIAVLLVEKTAFGVAPTISNGPSVPTKARAKKKGVEDLDKVKKNPKEAREYARAHGVQRGGSKKLDDPPDGVQPPLNPDSPDEALLTFVQSTSCRRKVWAEVFESDICSAIVPCCDICDTSLLDRTRPATLPASAKGKNPKRGLPDLDAEDKLHLWRDTVYSRDHPYAQYDETAILPDHLITLLVSHGRLSSSEILAFLRDKWIFWDKHGEDLTDYILSLEICYKPPPTKSRTSVKRAAQQTTLDSSSHEVVKRRRLDTEAPNVASSAGTSRQAPCLSPPHTLTPRPSSALQPCARPVFSTACLSLSPSSPAGNPYYRPSPGAQQLSSPQVRTPQPVPRPAAMQDYSYGRPPVMPWTTYASMPGSNPHAVARDAYTRDQVWMTPTPRAAGAPPLTPYAPLNAPCPSSSTAARTTPVSHHTNTNYSVPSNRSSSINYVAHSMPPTPMPSLYHHTPASGIFPATALYPAMLPHPFPSSSVSTAPLPYQYVHTSSPTQNANCNLSPTLPSISHYYSQPASGLQ